MSPTAMQRRTVPWICIWLLVVAAPTLVAQPFPSQLRLDDLDASTGYVLRGVQLLDEAGKSVSRAGDWNGDGIEDLLIGAPVSTRSSRWVGESYVVFGSETVPESPLWLGDLDGTDGVILRGAHVVGFAGMSVSNVGDMNSDGIDDVLIGAGIASPNFNNEVGESYILFGTRSSTGKNINLGQLDGTAGFFMRGLRPPERMGTSVSGAGDFNGDGVPDYVMGANGATPGAAKNSGATYLVFGTAGAQQPDLAQLNGSNGLVIEGLFAGDFLGNGVSNAGDFNGDGLDDLVLGAPRSKRDGVERIGEAYLVYGSRSNEATFSVLDLDGTNGFAMMGTTGFEEMGFIVSTAGDVNKDGYDDVLVAAPFANRPNRAQGGEVVLLFGNNKPWPAVLSASGITPEQGRVIASTTSNAQLGYGVGAAGDVNDDGIDDFILGAPLASPGGLHQAGVSYVIFGVDGAFPAQIDLTTLDGTNGFAIEGVAAGDRSGWSVSGAGDWNGDGIDDLVIGAPSATRDGRRSTGEVYVVFGRSAEEVAVDLADFSLRAQDGAVELQWTLSSSSLRDVRQIQVQRLLRSEVVWQTLPRVLVPQRDMQFRDDLTVQAITPQPGDVLQYRLVLTASNGDVTLSAALQVAWSQKRVTALATPVRADGGVRIQYSLGEATTVHLAIFDVRGRQVHAFAPRSQPGGAYVQRWDMQHDSRGGRVAPGVYLVHLKAGPYAAARKVVLTRD